MKPIPTNAAMHQKLVDAKKITQVTGPRGQFQGSNGLRYKIIGRRYPK